MSHTNTDEPIEMPFWWSRAQGRKHALGGGAIRAPGSHGRKGNFGQSPSVASFCLNSVTI